MHASPFASPVPRLRTGQPRLFIHMPKEERPGDSDNSTSLVQRSGGPVWLAGKRWGGREDKETARPALSKPKRTRTDRKPIQTTTTHTGARMSHRKFRAPRHGSLGFLVRTTHTRAEERA